MKANGNLPKDILILHTKKDDKTTWFFINKDGELLSQADDEEKPIPITQHILYKETGITPKMAKGQYDSWLRYLDD